MTTFWQAGTKIIKEVIVGGRKLGTTKSSKKLLLVSDEQLASDIAAIGLDSDAALVDLYDSEWSKAKESSRFYGWSTLMA